jgi:eukaryotic-like serine/threonine-protein kinase
MALPSGTRVGPYSIVAQLGSGGMGEVYRATDTKLKREVALKILPESFAADPDRLARFQREAEVLASLNHPNIAHIHGLEEADGVKALVMELVEGPTLADRITQGAVPLEEALPIAKQIAEALEAAHEQGIVHRDLKPANIKVRPDGTVKVLDFGLAKAMDSPTGSSASVSMSPTITTPAMTQAGMILGTAAYMAPEQARGTKVDKRADLWAFGVVLWEMLTAKRLFEGATVSDTLAAVLKTEPDWTALAPTTPFAIRRLLRRCLEKDQRRRLADAADARIEIDEAQAEPSNTAPETHALSRRTERLAWLSSLAVVAIVAALGMFFRPGVAPAAAPRSEMRLEINTPPTTDPASFAISPDGQILAFVAMSEGQPRLWVRPLDSISARALPETDGAGFLFWSPDSRSVAFFADGQLKRIEIDGGSPRTLASAPSAVGGSWGPDGVILFSMLGNPIFRVSDVGGDPMPVTRLNALQGAHYSPQFLPDGRHFLYWAVSGREPNGVFVGRIDGSETRRLLDADFAAVYAPQGYLLLVRQARLFAQPFDPALMSLTGTPFPVADQITNSTERISPAVSVSGGGTIAYRTGSEQGAGKQLTWFDRSGKELAVNMGGRFASTQLSPQLSPDGRQVALFRLVGGNVDVWLIDVGRGVPTRFTFDSADDVMPLWSHDGHRIVFSSNRRGAHDLYLKSTASGSEETLLLQSPQFKVATDWSSDGRFLLYQSVDPKRNNDIWALPLDKDGKPSGQPVPVVQTDFDEHGGQFSPDGKWIAYVSLKSGRYEVYVQPFGRPGGGEIRMSIDGGDQVRWRPDGRELFYVARDGRLMAVPVRVGSNGETVEPGTPVPLFQTRVVRGTPIGQTQYAVSADGLRFLMNSFIEDTVTSPITVMLNWKARP